MFPCIRTTARQYGEVVLPDASTGHVLSSLARKLSRCKEGMAHFLLSWYKFNYVLARSRYKFDRSSKFIPSYKFGCGHWRSVGIQAVSKAGAKAKSVTNNLPILSVLGLDYYFKILNISTFLNLSVDTFIKSER